jgi:hypothetical protein
MPRGLPSRPHFPPPPIAYVQYAQWAAHADARIFCIDAKSMFFSIRHGEIEMNGKQANGGYYGGYVVSNGVMPTIGMGEYKIGTYNIAGVIGGVATIDGGYA